jgi:hypothetical protein
MPLIALAWPKRDYVVSLERAGAAIRELAPGRDPLPDALDRCDGVLLTGGADVDPVRYGETHRHPSVEVAPDRDDYELALARLALERQMPLLAICRGVQVLNVRRRFGTRSRTPRTPSPTTCASNRRRIWRAWSGAVAPAAPSPSTAVTINRCVRSRRDSSFQPPHLTASSRPSRSRARRSASVSSGTRRTSGEPENSRGCSPNSCAWRTNSAGPRPSASGTREDGDRLDVRRIGKEIERLDRLESIPAPDQPRRITRERRWVARNIHEPRRLPAQHAVQRPR